MTRLIFAQRRPVWPHRGHHILLATMDDGVTSFNVQQRLGRMRVLTVLAVTVLVDPGDESLGCWRSAFEVEDEGVDLHW